MQRIWLTRYALSAAIAASLNATAFAQEAATAPQTPDARAGVQGQRHPRWIPWWSRVPPRPAV